jgi:uncharacterized membrane protein
MIQVIINISISWWLISMLDLFFLYTKNLKMIGEVCLKCTSFWIGLLFYFQNHDLLFTFSMATISAMLVEIKDYIIEEYENR